MANPDFPLQTNMLMDGNTIFNTFVKVVIGKTPLYYILTCTFKACYKITFRNAWYTTYPDYLCVLGYRAGITSTQFHPLCYAWLGLVGRDYAVCPEGMTGFKTANRIFREVSCVHLLPPGLS